MTAPDGLDGLRETLEGLSKSVGLAQRAVVRVDARQDETTRHRLDAILDGMENMAKANIDGHDAILERLQGKRTCPNCGERTDGDGCVVSPSDPEVQTEAEPKLDEGWLTDLALRMDKVEKTAAVTDEGLHREASALAERINDILREIASDRAEWRARLDSMEAQCPECSEVASHRIGCSLRPPGPPREGDVHVSPTGFRTVYSDTPPASDDPRLPWARETILQLVGVEMTANDEDRRHLDELARHLLTRLDEDAKRWQGEAAREIACRVAQIKTPWDESMDPTDVVAAIIDRHRKGGAA